MVMATHSFRFQRTRGITHSAVRQPLQCDPNRCPCHRRAPRTPTPAPSPIAVIASPGERPAAVRLPGPAGLTEPTPGTNLDLTARDVESVVGAGNIGAAAVSSCTKHLFKRDDEVATKGAIE